MLDAMTSDRAAARHALIAIAVRRQRPGSGSFLRRLMERGATQMDWWDEVLTALGEVPHAVAGAVAANAYMPPRQTADLDVAVRLADLPGAEEAIERAGWKKRGVLNLAGGLGGSGWEKDGEEVDLLGLPGAWGEEVIAGAQENVIAGRPTLALPDLVIAKLIAGRGTDIGDLTRMLGAADETALAAVRVAVARHLPDAADDLDQLIALGRIEFEGSEPAGE